MAVDHLAVLVINGLIRVDLVSGIGCYLHNIRGAGSHGGVLLIDGFPGGLREDLVAHFYIGAIHIGAQDLNGEIALFIFGDDLHGVQGVVGELIVGAAPGHRGIHAPGDVSGDIAVGVPLRDLQIAQETGQIQGGGGLANAAADLVHGFALDIGGGGLEAPVRRPFADGSVVGEGFSAVENKAVDNLSGELNVADPPGGAGDMGLGLAQHVPEQDGLQIGGGDLRLLNISLHSQRFAGSGLVHGLLNGGDVEIGPQLLRYDGVRSGVIGGISHLAVELVVELLGGEGLGGDGLEGDGDLIAALTVIGNICQKETEILRCSAVPCLGDVDRLPLHSAGGVKGCFGKLLRQTGYGFGKGGLVHVRPMGTAGPATGDGGQIGPAFLEKALVLIIVFPELSVPRKILCRVTQVPHGKMGQGLAFVIHKGDRLLEKLSLQALLRLFHGKTAYVDAVDVAVGIKCIQRTGIGAKARVGRQQNRQHDAGDQQRSLPTLFGFLVQPLPRLGLHLGFTDRFHKKPSCFDRYVK